MRRVTWVLVMCGMALRQAERERLAVWKDVLHWQLRGRLTVSLIEQPAQEEKPLERGK